MSITVLPGHDCAENAHITFDYPYGRGRCLRREWIEHADKGQQRGRYRFVTQTTHPSFNADYTERLRRDGPDAADGWASELLANTPARIRWNKPDTATYSDLVVMTQQPLDDGRPSTRHITLTFYASLEQIAAFKDLVGDHLSEHQRARLQAIETQALRAAKRAS
jgi:hypothetical protein